MIAEKHLARFWRRVEKTDTCWNWTGPPRHAGGYGAFWDGKRVVLAHRFVYQAEVGVIPPGYVVDHVCRNRQCVRPDHLRAVTIKQNGENRGARSTRTSSGFRGVHWDKRAKRWMAHVTHNYRFHYGGHFDDVNEAAEAAAKLRAELFTHSEGLLSG